MEDLAGMIKTDYLVNGRRATNRLRTALKHLCGFFGKRRALDINTARLKSYIAYRQAEGTANASIARVKEMNCGAQGYRAMPSSQPFMSNFVLSSTIAPLRKGLQTLLRSIPTTGSSPPAVRLPPPIASPRPAQQAP